MYKKYTTNFLVPYYHGYIRKFLLVMRLTAILLFAAFLQVSAKSFSQQVTLDVRNASIAKVLDEVRSQTGYDFIYNTDILKDTKAVSIHATNKPLKEVLDQCFADQPITYEIQNKVVVLSEKKVPNLIDKIKRVLAQIDARGQVVDEQGLPIPGATVKLKNGKAATITDEKGRFVISNCNTGDLIVITFIGYNAKEVSAAADMGTIKLEPATSELDQVVVRAYDKTNQRLNIGNISTITSAQIENKPITNPLLALQGEAPGVFIEQQRGYTNSGIKIQIQGPNSIAYSNDPFYVIDGVPYPSQNMPNKTGNLVGSSSSAGRGFGAQGGSPMSFINPEDIESISILKDAEATAIYGTRAANGAIVITTKKGKVGPGKFTLDLEQGYEKDRQFLKLLNRDQYLRMRRDAYYGTDGLTNSSSEFATQYDLNGVWDNTRETDWQKVLLGGTAQFTDIHGTLSGGSVRDQYLISGTYNRQTSILPVSSFPDQKASMHVNLNHESVNGKFKLDFSSEYLLDNNQMANGDITGAATFLAPVAPALYNADGTLNWQPDANGLSTWKNPLAAFQAKLKNKTGNLISNLNLSYQLMKGFLFNTKFGYANMQQNEVVSYPSAIYPPEYTTLYGVKPSSQFDNGNTNTWTVEPQLRYTRVISKLKLDAMIGGTVQRNNVNLQSFNATNYDNEQLLENIAAAGQIRPSATISQYRYQSAYGSLNLNSQDKYLLNFNVRRDGSSRFGSDNRYHDFWSVATGWVFTEENLIKNNLSWLSFGKIHASYGTTGSDGIGDYTYLNQYGILYAAVPYQQTTALTPLNLPNPALQWEETRKLSAGLNLGFLRDRIVFNAEYYSNRSSNQLLNYALPVTTGFQSVPVNRDATVQNTGLEFSLVTRPVVASKFKWTSSFNLTFNRNKLVSYPGLATSSYATQLVVGQPIDIIKLYRFAGLNAQTGLYQFQTADGNTTSNPTYPDDRYVLLSVSPKYYGGWSNSFVYGNFELSIVVQFTEKPMRNNLFGSLPGLPFVNQPEAYANYWRQPGDQASLQQVSTTYPSGISIPWSDAASSNAAYVNDFYIRIKNVSLAYKLPDGVNKKLGMQESKLFINAQNLFTITNYKWGDPESGYGGLPPLQTIVLGLRASF